METEKALTTKSILIKKNEVEGINLPNFKLYYEAIIIIKKYVTGTNNIDQWNGKESPERTSYTVGQIKLQQRRQEYTMGNVQSLQ